MATILVVDDRPLNRDFLITLLGYFGHVLLEAADGAEALEVVGTQPLDLVISDILMPTMDGIDFVRRLRSDERTAALPVIFYTATYRVREARELGLTCGVTAVLAKPAEPLEVLEAVNAALGVPPPGADLPTPPELALTSPTDQPPDSTPDYLRGLALLQQQLQSALEAGLSLLGEQGELRQVSDRITASLTAAQSLGLRLTTLIKLGLELASERNVPRLLEVFVRAAQDILSTRYAGVGLAGADGRARLVATRGLPEQVQAAFAASPESVGTLGRVLTTGRPQLGKGGDPAPLGLPAEHPRVEMLLAVPVKSSQRVHGWLYLADKIGAEDFSAEDERIAVTLAAQLALAYENLALYDDARQHAQQLEREAAERQRAEATLRESEQHFRQLAENIREVFFLVDPASGEQLYVSPAYQEIWGAAWKACTRPPWLGPRP